MARKIGDIIAYWNLEHTKAARNLHMKYFKQFLKTTGIDEIMEARDATYSYGTCIDMLGYPRTGIDLVLKEKHRQQIYRNRLTGGRVRDLTVIHLSFARNAGVYDPDKHGTEVMKLTSRNPISARDAARISRWPGWEDTVCEYMLKTDARYCRYRGKLWTGFDGARPGDSFGYARDWGEVHDKAADAVYSIVTYLGIKEGGR